MTRRMGAGRESKHVAVIVDSARETKKPPYISAGRLVFNLMAGTDLQHYLLSNQVISLIYREVMISCGIAFRPEIYLGCLKLGSHQPAHSSKRLLTG